MKLVFGSAHAGDAANVIPTHATLRASVRTPSLDAWEAMPRAFEMAVSRLLDGTGATYETTYVHGVPPVVNDGDVTDMVRRAASIELGKHALTDAGHSWGGDDFAWYLREGRGTYIRLGTHDPDSDNDHFDLHVGHFDVDERAIATGIRLLTAAVYTHLEERAAAAG
jgi:amidohydrolase